MRQQKINVRKEMEEVIPTRWYATHHFDKYPAKMIPQLARFCIERCTNRGDSVLDPFCGCGTAIIESRIAGRKATGLEINPYAAVLTKAKSYLYKDVLLTKAINRTLEDAKLLVSKNTVKDSWVNYWFGSNTLNQLLSLREAIKSNKYNLKPSYICALQAILAVTVRLVSYADPRSPKPFISKTARQQRLHKNFDAFKFFLSQANRFIEASRKYRKLIPNGHLYRVNIICDDARYLVTNKNLGSYNAVISSPPYLSAQDYYRSSKLEVEILGLMNDSNLSELGPLIIGSGRGRQPTDAFEKAPFIPVQLKQLAEIDKRSAIVVLKFLCDMMEVIKGIHFRLKYNGYCCLIIGDSVIRKIKLPTHKWIKRIAQQNKLYLQEHFVDIVKSCRVPPKRIGHNSVIDKEHILIFKKTK